MKRFILLILGIFLSACTSLPNIKPVDFGAENIMTDPCAIPFSEGKKRWTHTIEAAFPGGGSSMMIGIALTDSDTQTIHSVMMTLEGMVLFDGEQGSDGTLTVNRAVPPFDDPDMAAGMIRDMRMIFYPPEGERIASGRFPDSASGCRFRMENGEVTDVKIRPAGNWEIFRYKKSGKLIRSVKASQIKTGQIKIDQVKIDHVKIDQVKNSLPHRIELEGRGVFGYRLVLKLIEAGAWE